MRTALRRALATAAVTTVAAGGLLIAQPAAFAASACSTDCITVSDVSGTPEGAVLTFATTALSRVKVVVTDLDGNNATVVKQDDSWGSNYQVTADDAQRFQQGAIYKFSIYATDTAGATWGYSGEFVTLVRTATVHYDNLHVITDGDSGAADPGDFAGRGRCVDGTPWKPLSPLSFSLYAVFEAELSDGDNLAVNATYSCAGTIGKTVDAQTAVADDDLVLGQANTYPWLPSSPYARAMWQTPDFDSSYTADVVADPLEGTSTGSAAVSIDITSPTKDTLVDDLVMRYEMTGTVTFEHSVPMVNLPAPTNGPLALSPHVTQGSTGDAAVITWQPGAFASFSNPLPTRVLWKPHSSSSWLYSDVLYPWPRPSRCLTSIRARSTTSLRPG